MTIFLHPQALCESSHVGAGTRIWAFAHVLSHAVLGRDCNICDGVFIENDVIVGDRVTVKCGVQLWDGVRLADDVFVGPNVSFANDAFPRSRQQPEKFLKTVVLPGASIGANATILPGLTIGRGAMIGAGAVVTKNVPAHAVVMGNPGRVTRFADTPRMEPMVGTAVTPLPVAGASLHALPRHRNPSGSLVVGDFQATVPLATQRYFTVFDVPLGEIRGAHAHRQCQQFLVCMRGAITALVDDGRNRCEVRLNRPDLGMLLPPMVWGTQYEHTTDAILTVFASHPYDNGDYMRDYEQFITQAGTVV